jgi:hypothetical protein
MANTIDLQSIAMTAARPQLDALVAQAKKNFMAAYGSFVEAAHKDKLEKLFAEAGEAKIKALSAEDQKKSREWADIYETKLASIETLGLAVKVVGDAKAASFLRETARQILDTLGGVAAAIFKTVISAVVQGVVQGFTGGSGGGLDAVANSFLGKKG